MNLWDSCEVPPEESVAFTKMSHLNLKGGVMGDLVIWSPEEFFFWGEIIIGKLPSSQTDSLEVRLC